VPVDPHFAALVHPVEEHADALAANVFRKAKALAIPADAGRQIAARSPGRLVLTVRAENTLVVRQIDAAPAGLRDAILLASRDIAPDELPIFIKASLAQWDGDPLRPHHAGLGSPRQCRCRSCGNGSTHKSTTTQHASPPKAMEESTFQPV
jgi:hypothetical protein